MAGVKLDYTSYYGESARSPSPTGRFPTFQASVSAEPTDQAPPEIGDIEAAGAQNNTIPHTAFMDGIRNRYACRKYCCFLSL